ncbi:hypothetical protein AgCh_009553 [Apium graveolens]
MSNKEEESHNPNSKPPPPVTSQISSNMSRYEAIKVPMLKIHEYPIWKVRIAMSLEATDPEYLNRIYDGPHRPMMLRSDTFCTAVLIVLMSDGVIGYEIYGVLKTYELELEQRSKRKGSKARPVTLKVEKKPKEKARRKSYFKGKAMIAKSDTELSNSDDDSNTDTKSDTDSDHNNNEDMDQMAALLVKSFKKMVYKNFKKERRFSKKGSSSSNSNKRNNRRNTDGKESRSGKLDKSRERRYNCDGLGHFTVDCRKPRAEKKQALISRKRNWDDSSNSDDGVNYALIEKADIEADNAELEIYYIHYIFCTIILDAHKLTGPNFADWLRNLRIVLRVEKPEYVLDSPKPTEPASDAHNDEYVMSRRTARYEISKELFGCRMSEGSSVNDHVLKMINLIERLGQLGFAMDGELSQDFFLQSLPSSNPKKRKKNPSKKKKVGEKKSVPPKAEDPKSKAVCFHCNKGLRKSRTLEEEEVILRIGNGARVVAEAVGSFHLHMPTGKTIVLNNCYFIPSIVMNIISIPC